MNKQILRQVIFGGLFVIPFIPFFVSSSFFFPFITTKAFAFRIIVEIIFGAWLVLALFSDDFKIKKSPILKALLAFILIIGVANLFGLEPAKSFWSNYERMEGYITLLHLGAMFLVMGSVFGDKEWGWWWNTSLSASLLMVFYAVFQLLGAFEIHQGGARVDGSIGNAAYLALYLLIHIFVALYYFVKNKKSEIKWVYLGLIVAQTSIMYLTATRGAILGLLGGLFVIALLNLKNKEDAWVRRMSQRFLVALVVFVGIFYLARDTRFVNNSPVLSRFSHLSVSSLKTEGRAFVWPMAIEGIKERPILGWGQDNFNYVFAKHYKGEMFRLEPWFDRAHNIFLDWGIAGGLLGLLAYLSLYLYFIVSLWWRDNTFSYVEKTTLTGLIAAYFFNNFFVFDNLLSYILFISLLAYVHTKTAKEEMSLSRVSSKLSESTFTYSAIIVTILVVYFVNIKPIIANTTLIKGLQVAQSGGSKAQAIKYFEKSYEGSRLGRPESVEWISSSAVTILSDESIPMEERNRYFEFSKKAIEDMTNDLSNDPRYEIVAGNFYANVGTMEDAKRHFNKALELMPEKQVIYFSLGQLAIQEGKPEEAVRLFKTAYEIAPDYQEAVMIYLIGAIYVKDYALVDELLAKTDPKVLLNDARVLAAMYQTGQRNLLRSTLLDLKKKLPEQSSQIDEYVKQLESL